MMVYGEGYLMDQHARFTGRFPATEPFNLWRLIYYGDYILQQTVFMRKKVFDVIPMVDESLHYGMDWDLFIRIGKRFKVDYVPEYLGALREYPEAKSFAGGVQRLQELTSIMRRHGNRRYPPAFFQLLLAPYRTHLWKNCDEPFPGSVGLGLNAAASLSGSSSPISSLSK
jgi:hypothetical protein